MFEIKIVKTKDELKELFLFLSETFYKDAIKHNEYYYKMGDRFVEMNDQFNREKDFLMYIKDEDKIIAGITGKNSNTKDGKITLGVLAVDEKYRNKGLASKFVNTFEDTCKKKGIKHIDLGARFRATPLYLKLGYSYSLMIQVFDFITIDDIRKNNKYNFLELSSYQSDAYGFIIYKVDGVKEEYINYFKESVPTSYAQYIFEKDL